jgi:hypothetical protein
VRIGIVLRVADLNRSAQMNLLRYFAWLAGQAFDGLLYGWPISVCLIVVLATAMLIEVRSERLIGGSWIAEIAVPFAGPIYILICGTLLQKQRELWILPYVGVALTFALAAVCVYRCRAFWKTAAAISLCSLWFSLWCGFISVMSITGDWM